MSTGHANSPQDMLSRLETMALFASDIPIQAIRKQIASSIDIIVQLERLRDRSRRVTAIAEVLDCTEDAYILNPIFEFHEQDNLVMESSSYGDIPERVVGQLERTGYHLMHRRKCYMNMCSSEYMNILYTGLTGRLVMTAALMVYAAAVWTGHKILDIHV